MSRGGRTCECGQAKQPGAEACPRCVELDGDGMPEKKLIDGLRQLGGEGTTEAVLVESGMSYRAFRRAAAKLEASGRLLRLDTGEERHVNQPSLVLSDDGPRVKPWRQQTLPRFEVWMEPSREAAESRRIVNIRRASSRERAPVQLSLKFRWPRKTQPTEAAAVGGHR